MEEIKKYRPVNILIAILGVAACVGAFFIPAEEGILADESIDLLRAITPDQILIMFVMPSLLVVLAVIFVMIGKAGFHAVLTALAGGELYLWMDYGYAMSNRSCYGTLVNAIGVILVFTAALLQEFGTPTAKQIRKEKKKAASAELREIEREERLFFEEEPKESSHQQTEATSEDTGIDFEALKREALKIESKDLSVTQYIKESADDTGISSDDEITALLRNEIEAEEKTDAQFEQDTESPASSKPAGAGNMSNTMTKNITDFYKGLEDIFLDEQ